MCFHHGCGGRDRFPRNRLGWYVAAQRVHGQRPGVVRGVVLFVGIHEGLRIRDSFGFDGWLGLLSGFGFHHGLLGFPKVSASS